MIDRHNHPAGCVLQLHVPGADSHLLRRGAAVAKCMFDFERVHPYAAWTAARVAQANDANFPLTDEERAWATLWQQAQLAAITSCCGKHDAWPANCHLALNWPGAPGMSPSKAG